MRGLFIGTIATVHGHHGVIGRSASGPTPDHTDAIMRQMRGPMPEANGSQPAGNGGQEHLPYISLQSPPQCDQQLAGLVLRTREVRRKSKCLHADPVIAVAMNGCNVLQTTLQGFGRGTGPFQYCAA